MEDIENKTNNNNENLHLEKDSLFDLDEVRKWTMFLAILGFVMMGLMLILTLFAGSLIPAYADARFGSGVTSVISVVFTIIILVIYFFPIYYLFRFSTYMKGAIEKKSSWDLKFAFRNLLSHYRFVGVLTIIFLSLYLIFFLISTMFGLFR